MDELEEKAAELEVTIAKQHRIQVLQNGMIETLSNDTMVFQTNAPELNKTAYDRREELFILDSDAKFYFKISENVTKAISTQYFGGCKSIDNHTICNCLVLEMAHSLNECI